MGINAWAFRRLIPSAAAGLTLQKAHEKHEAENGRFNSDAKAKEFLCALF